MKFGRGLMIAGGALLAAQAFLPTYVRSGLQRVDFPDGHYELHYRRAAEAPAAVWVSTGSGMWISWLMLLPHLFGLAVALGHLLDARSTRFLGVYRLVMVLACIPFGGVAVVGTLACVVAMLAEPWEIRGEALVALGLLLGAVAIFAVLLRSLKTSAVDRSPPYLRLLVYQGAVALVLSSWLAGVVASLEGRTADGWGIWAGIAGWALLLVGTHVTARFAVGALRVVSDAVAEEA
jgi:hypothetical protein